MKCSTTIPRLVLASAIRTDFFVQGSNAVFAVIKNRLRTCMHAKLEKYQKYQMSMIEVTQIKDEEFNSLTQSLKNDNYIITITN